MEGLRTDTQNDFLVYEFSQLRCYLCSRNLNLILNSLAGLGSFCAEFYIVVVGLLQDSVDEVHLRRTQESCNELVARLLVQSLRGIYLLDDTVSHNNDTVTHGHSLGLVVGYVDECRTQLLVELGDLGSHLRTELCVQVGQRLVKQEYLRITNDCTAQRNTLSLTAGHSLRLTIQQVAQIQDLCSFFYLTCDLILRNLTQLQTECHVVKYGHVRIQSVVLEYHCDISVLRSDVVYQAVADVQLALRDFFQTSDHTQGGRLTAAGRAYQYDKFLVLDFQIYVLYSNYIARIFLINMSK